MAIWHITTHSMVEGHICYEDQDQHNTNEISSWDTPRTALSMPGDVDRWLWHSYIPPKLEYRHFWRSKEFICSFRRECEPRSSLCTHAFHHMICTGSEAHVLDRWIPASPGQVNTSYRNTLSRYHIPSQNARTCMMDISSYLKISPVPGPPEIISHGEQRRGRLTWCTSGSGEFDAEAPAVAAWEDFLCPHPPEAGRRRGWGPPVVETLLAEWWWQLLLAQVEIWMFAADESCLYQY